MIPILYEIRLFGWNLSLPAYGVLLAVGFLLALAVGLRQARRAGVESAVVTDLWIVSLISGIVGAKLLLYLLDFRYYLENPGAIIGTLRSAGVWYGGLILAIIACLVAVRRRGLDGWVIGDVLAPAIVLGQAVGRLGCFAAGCCYGRPTTLPWAVVFTNPRAHEITGAPLGVPLHPSQIYHALGNVVVFLVLLRLARRKKFHGQVILAYLILYAAARGALEYFRGDPRGAVLGLSTSQMLSLVVGLIAVSLYIQRSRRAGSSAPTGGRRGGRKTAPVR